MCHRLATCRSTTVLQTSGAWVQTHLHACNKLVSHDMQTQLAHELARMPMCALTQQQSGCHEEERSAFRLAIADALLEGHACDRRKEGPNGPHRPRVAAHVLCDGFWLRMSTDTTSGHPLSGAEHDFKTTPPAKTMYGAHPCR